MAVHSPFLFAAPQSLIRFSHRTQLHVSLNRPSSPIHYIYIKTRKRKSKSRRFPTFDSDVVFSSTVVRVLRQTGTVASYIRAVQMENADAKTLHATDLSFNVCDSRHRRSLLLHPIANCRGCPPWPPLANWRTFRGQTRA